MSEQMNFLKLSTIPLNTEQSLETDLLEPVVFNDGSATTTGFVRFTLQRKGVLHSHSKLLLALKPPTTVSNGFYAPSIGIGSVIESARLMCGNQVINEISSWGNFHSVKSMMISNENNVEREQYTTGRGMSHQFIYTAGDDSQSSNVGFENGREYTGTALNQQPFARMNGVVDASGYLNSSESPTYSIDLSDLFPFLKVHQLPLAMINQDISIELTLTQQEENRACVKNGVDAAKAVYTIDRNELKFCADYIFWGNGDDFQKYMEQNRSQTFSFVDHRLTTTSIASTDTSVIRNIGMANRMVNRIVTTFQNDAGTDVSILNKYGNLAMNKDGNSVVGGIEYNIRYNDRFEYSSNVSNPAQLFTLSQQAEGVPSVVREEYSNEGDLLTTNTYEGSIQNADLGGQFFFVSTRLSAGRVGERGIELHLTLDSQADVTTMRTWSEYMRVAVLEDGIFTIYNA